MRDVAVRPGIDPTDTLVQVYIGTELLEPVSLNPISGTGRSFSEYWNPRFCPAPASVQLP
jgi:hypothetical protein